MEKVDTPPEEYLQTGAASISFRRLEDLDLGVLAELVERALELTPGRS